MAASVDGQRERGAARVVVVIPAYNEAPTIARVVAGCRAHADAVLVVDDGSRDATSAEAERAGARVHRLARNRGKGWALREGIELAADADVLVFIDADGQDDPDEIPLLLRALAPGVDMVIGSRFIGTFEPGAITMINRLGSHALCGVLNALFRTRVTDPFAGFRAIRRAALERCSIRAERYDIEVDVLLALLQVPGGGRVVEIPVRRSPREHGASGLDSVVDGTRILCRILDRRLDAPRAWLGWGR